MSPSLNDFQNLTIGGMPETRSQTHRGQQARRSRGGRSSARGGHVAQTPTRANSQPIHGHSGLLYDIESLSPGSAQRATTGLGSEFFVDRLQSHETSRGAYYAFQLKKPVSVRIHNPANGNKVECTCEEYQQSQSACVHVYWLFDGLKAVLVEDSKGTTHTITQGEVVAQLSGLYDLIGERLASLPDQLNATRGDEAESDSDESEADESYASSNSDIRKETVRDMLSVFDRRALPSEYGLDFPENAPAAASGTELYVPGSLAATIYEVAIRDEVFFRRLRKVITRDICAGSYFWKQWVKAKELMAELDRFAGSGPLRQAQTTDVTVPACARGLRLIVHQIFENRDARTAREPLGPDVISKVVEVLVEILHEVVCNRNRDIFEHMSGEGAAEGHERDRNLFTYLIGNPPRFDSSVPLAMRDDFIIDRLREFPPREWRHLLERLTTIIDSIHENAPGNAHAIAYAAKLELMVREYTTEAFEPSSSSVQRRRPTISSPRESQRRRFG